MGKAKSYITVRFSPSMRRCLPLKSCRSAGSLPGIRHRTPSSSDPVAIRSGDKLAKPSQHGSLKNLTSNAEPEQVRAMFGSIAARYDLANHALSCGLDFFWRRRVVDMVKRWSPHRVLDLATGTGDLALLLQDRLPDAEITGADFSAEMLEVARRKGLKRTTLADARQLPFADEAFDVVTIAFGLRNLPDWTDGLREMRRVIRHGGHLLVLDFSLPEQSLMRALYRFYLHRVVPFVGGFLTHRPEAYDYLGESIENFPRGPAMVELMAGNRFRGARAQPLTFGIVTIYTAEKSE
jgi:demethylmenaquinone methyltransferase / 2-methoxy-6-polyprenyl-1,4-benzoquinol methylase